MNFPRAARVRPAGVEMPIPQRKYQHVGDPERAGGAQQQYRWLLVLGKRADQQNDRADDRNSDHCAYQQSEDAVEGMLAGAMKGNRRDQQDDNRH